MNLIKTINFFIERKIKPGFGIGENDIVLDIGSGDKPFWRANVFLDKLSLKNLHRHTDSKVINNLGPFVDSDIAKTPFKDKAFDFSFCAHLLEHVERPDLAINEIMRISKKGYIEVPNGVIEYISPFHSHLWFILLVKNKLVFYRKSTHIHKNLLENSENYFKIISQIDEPFIRFYWNKKINYEIIDNEKDKYFPPNKTPKTRKNSTILKASTLFYMSLVRILRLIYKVNNRIDINALIKN